MNYGRVIEAGLIVLAVVLFVSKAYVLSVTNYSKDYAQTANRALAYILLNSNCLNSSEFIQYCRQYVDDLVYIQWAYGSTRVRLSVSSSSICYTIIAVAIYGPGNYSVLEIGVRG